MLDSKTSQYNALNLDDLKWLIDRSDKLRSGLASSAGILVSAISLFLTAVSVAFSYVTSRLLPTSREMWGPGLLIAGLLLAGFLLVVAMLKAISVIAIAHGFYMSAYKHQNKMNSLGDVTEDLDTQHFSKSLSHHLVTATLFQRESRERIRSSLLWVAFAIAVPFAIFMGGSMVREMVLK